MIRAKMTENKLQTKSKRQVVIGKPNRSAKLLRKTL